MKFRAKLVDIGCIQQFSSIVQTVAKLSKICTLHITTDKLHFVLSEKLVTGGTAIWCELQQANFFNEFNMEGVNKEANEIYLEFVGENLVRCLKSAQTARSIKIKLTKKQHPCLTLEVDVPLLSGNSRLVTHDIPVEVIPRRQWSNYAEPESPEFDVSVFMPPVKVLRNVIDRMKNLSNFVTMSASDGSGQGLKSGAEMKLSVETDTVTITTHFRDLDQPTWQLSQADENRNKNSGKFFNVRVDIRKFAQFLSGQQINPSKMICNIVDDQMVHVMMMNDDVSLQFFMPCICS